jgi:hypothetical protein
MDHHDSCQPNILKEQGRAYAPKIPVFLAIVVVDILGIK